MAVQVPTCFFIVLVLLFPGPFEASTVKQSLYFSLAKKSLTGNAMLNWTTMGDYSYCSYPGISCDDQQQYVTKINVSGWLLSGYLPPNICSYLPCLRALDISKNKILGGFPAGIANCSLLETLSMSSLYLGGEVPDLSGLKSLRVLDLSYNLFTGYFPISITNLTNLEAVNFNENVNFNLWQLPSSISRLTNLKTMILTSCMIQGRIPPSLGNMTSLIDLELSGNYLEGLIPPELGRLKNLRLLELYYNELLSGTIPEELGNLTELTDLDMSVNQLSGSIPDSLCRLPNLRALQMYNNSLTGEIPTALGDSKTLAFLSLYDNFLTGPIPANLGKYSNLILVELSENKLSGQIPQDMCRGGQLMYILILGNALTGGLPENYVNCTSLLRLRASNNLLEGTIPAGIFGLPHVSILDLANNQFTGTISGEIRSAKNLSELFMQNNRISGIMPPEISTAGNLVKVDLSNNLLAGPIPAEVGQLKKLNMLLLQGNKFNSSIPQSLASLSSLNVLDLSRNQLTGSIPAALSELLPISINFSSNLLSGPIPLPFIQDGQEEIFLGNPGLCVTTYLDSSPSHFPLCSKSPTHKRLNRIWIIVTSVVVTVVGTALCLKQWLTKQKKMAAQDEKLSSFFSYDVKSFHRISFDQREIVESLVDKNILGHGGSGTVYRIQLSSGEVVAVKKLWSHATKEPAMENQVSLDKELQTEVHTLGSIRHKNIIKLYSYFSSPGCSLLVYEYMQNGNLWDALHKGKMLLEWPTRHQIALGIAQGLAYLHHNLSPSVIHRDIKSSNILLDVDYQPKVADFGVAKVLQARGGKDSTITVIVGTYGYLDPDYVNSSKATSKCDVYSFGVVLMELVTGKKPVETEFGENKNIINWISSNVQTKEGALEVLDKRLPGSFKEEMIKVLRIAIRCTARAPAPRPTMNEVVQLLIEVDSSRFNSFKLANKTNDASDYANRRNKF